MVNKQVTTRTQDRLELLKANLMTLGGGRLTLPIDHQCLN